MRTPFVTMRLRTTCFCNERDAFFDLTGATGERAGLVGRADEGQRQIFRHPVEAVVALGLVGDEDRLGRVGGRLR